MKMERTDFLNRKAGKNGKQTRTPYGISSFPLFPSFLFKFVTLARPPARAAGDFFCNLSMVRRVYSRRSAAGPWPLDAVFPNPLAFVFFSP